MWKTLLALNVMGKGKQYWVINYESGLGGCFTGFSRNIWVHRFGGSERDLGKQDFRLDGQSFRSLKIKLTSRTWYSSGDMHWSSQSDQDNRLNHERGGEMYLKLRSLAEIYFWRSIPHFAILRCSEILLQYGPKHETNCSSFFQGDGLILR